MALVGIIAIALLLGVIFFLEARLESRLPAEEEAEYEETWLWPKGTKLP